MQPGTWKTLATNNTSILRVGNSTGTMLPYSMSAVWDSTARKVHYIGMDHGYPNLRHVTYDEATNSWVFLSEDPDLGAAHGYEHLAINKFTGQLYHRKYNLGGLFNILRYTGGAWAPWANIPCGYEQVAVGTGFWSGALTGATNGAYIIYSSGEPNGMLCIVDPSSGAVLATAKGFGGASTYHSFFEYSPVKNVAVFGGGNSNPRKVWRLNSDRTVTALSDSPVDLGVQRGFVSADPVTGNFLILHSGNLYELNPAGSGTYNLLTGSRAPSSVGNPASPALASMFVVPIDTYGVVMYVTCTSSSCSVDLYKHAAGSGSRTPPPPSDTTSPSIPSGVSVVAASSSQINVSWAASTDNVAVQGYRVYRNGAQIATVSTTAYSDTNLSAATSYAYTIEAYDAAGNTSGQSAPSSATTQSAVSTPPPSVSTPPPSVSTPPPSGSANFQTRCSQPGVVKCVGFDSQAEITGDWGINPQGSLRGSSGGPTIDTSIKASGNGSMQFTIPAGQVGGAAGSFFANFSNDLSQQFGGNTEFYIQWRMRIDNNFYSATQGRVGMKHAITGTGSRPGLPVSSCTDLEIVIQNNGARGFPAMYHSCSGNPINYVPFEEPFGSYDFKLQNARPSPYCLYSQRGPASTAFAPLGNCFAYSPNEWMTFQQHVKLGPKQQKADGYWYFVGSHIDLWIAREGQPSQQIFNWGPYDLEASAIRGSAGGTDDQRYGQIWLLPYSGSDIYPNGGITWYDDLIISTTKIPDPGSVTTPGVQPPAAPTGLTLK